MQGWNALNGNVDTKGPLTKINLPLGTTVPPVDTTTASFTGNLPSDVANGSVRTAKLDVYDAQGNARSLTASYTKVDATHWNVSLDDGVNAPVTGTLDFGGTPTGTQAAGLTLNDGGVAVDLGGVTGYATMDTIAANTQNGQAAGTLQAFAIGQDGSLSGVFSNGVKEVLAQIAVATFNNPDGLTKNGDSTYGGTINSGLAQIGTAGTGLARPDVLGRPGDVERRPGPGVQQPDHRPARLPGELARHHRQRPDPAGPGQHEAVATRLTSSYERGIRQPPGAPSRCPARVVSATTAGTLSWC